MTTITREEFEGLQQGDVLFNENGSIEVQARVGKAIIIVATYGAKAAQMFSIYELEKYHYVLQKPIDHNCGFPLGDYTDKMVFVFVSDSSIEQASLNAKSSKSSPTRLKSVTKDYFETVAGHKFEFAVLCQSDRIELIK